MKSKLITLTVVVLMVSTALVYSFTLNDSKKIHPVVAQSVQIDMRPQTSSESIVIDHVRLMDNGYVVLRGIDGNRLGQIVEISGFLTKGEHRDIKIDLGAFYKGGQDLVVLVYKDTDKDQSFSGLDEPVTENGYLVGKYVRTGASLSQIKLEQDNNGMSMMMGSMQMFTVHYTDKGFSPARLDVPVGSMVEFVNESGGDMWVASDPHPMHDLLPTFDEFKGVKKGSVYSYVFDKKGTWPYHDHLNGSLIGVINVK